MARRAYPISVINSSFDPAQLPPNKAEHQHRKYRIAHLHSNESWSDAPSNCKNTENQSCARSPATPANIETNSRSSLSFCPMDWRGTEPKGAEHLLVVDPNGIRIDARQLFDE